jgi:hypothetical protein
VRELQNEVQRAAVFAKERIEAADLSPRILDGGREREPDSK